MRTGLGCSRDAIRICVRARHCSALPLFRNSVTEASTPCGAYPRTRPSLCVDRTLPSGVSTASAGTPLSMGTPYFAATSMLRSMWPIQTCTSDIVLLQQIGVRRLVEVDVQHLAVAAPVAAKVQDARACARALPGASAAAMSAAGRRSPSRVLRHKAAWAGPWSTGAPALIHRRTPPRTAGHGREANQNSGPARSLAGSSAAGPLQLK